MNERVNQETCSWTGPPIGLFWDQSLLWGLLCIETLHSLGVPFELLSSAAIVSGSLDHHRVLLVPGGWASHKTAALGETGKKRIEQFIQKGGSYLGFCGGAGLALSGPTGLALVPLKRRPVSERVPSASGEVWIHKAADHPIWHDFPYTLPVSIWWPSQFAQALVPEAQCLATYAAVGANFQVSDLPIADFEDNDELWDAWEKAYGINLNPERLMGHPAIIEASLGRGRLILSYPHLETPNDGWGNRLFLHILDYLDREAAPYFPLLDLPDGSIHLPGNSIKRQEDEPVLGCLHRARQAADELIHFGEHHLLWTWRLPWVLHWRRGIRGLEYGTLAVTLKALIGAAEAVERTGAPLELPLDAVERMEVEVLTFCDLAKRLLLAEKLVTLNGKLPKMGKVNQTVDELRTHLFGNQRKHEGLCRTLFDDLDRLLLHLLRRHPDLCSLPVQPEK